MVVTFDDKADDYRHSPAGASSACKGQRPPAIAQPSRSRCLPPSARYTATASGRPGRIHANCETSRSGRWSRKHQEVAGRRRRGDAWAAPSSNTRSIPTSAQDAATTRSRCSNCSAPWVAATPMRAAARRRRAAAVLVRSSAVPLRRRTSATGGGRRDNGTPILVRDIAMVACGRGAAPGHRRGRTTRTTSSPASCSCARARTLPPCSRR